MDSSSEEEEILPQPYIQQFLNDRLTSAVFRPRELRCHWRVLRCRRPRGVRTEAHLSDPMKMDTCRRDSEDSL